MKIESVVVGRRVIAAVALSGIPVGAEGMIVEDYGSGFTVAWDFPDCPLPALPPDKIAKMWAANPACPHRDGFDKLSELHLLIEAHDKCPGA